MTTIGALEQKFNQLAVTETDDNQTILDEEVWAAINAFFDENGLLKHKTVSYNDFIYNGIPRIIEANRHVIIEGESPDKSKKRYEVEFDEPFIEPPSFTETDGEQHRIYPMECLHRNITYASEIYVDVTVTSPAGVDRHRRVGHRVDVAGEQNPELAAEHDAERYPEGDSDDPDDRCLPGHRGGQLPLGEAERLQQGQVSPAAADRRSEREAKRDDRPSGQPDSEDDGVEPTVR